jgi:outer membrane protein assembly factor BamD
MPRHVSSSVLWRLYLAGALCLGPLGLGACDNEQPKTVLNYTADAKKAYEAALAEFNSHNWIEAQTLFREVKRKYSYSKYARLAELRIADADFEQDKFPDAIREYRQFVHDHRSDAEEVTYARSRIADAQYAQVGDSLFLASGEERDQAIILDTYKELRGFVHDYPNAKETVRMKKLLAEVTGRLIKHELYVARFYLGKNNFEAAILRIQYALRNFARSTAVTAASGSDDDLGLEPEALLLMGETYLKMKKYGDARDTFDTLLRRYPGSAYVVPARNYLGYMHTQGV